MVWYWYCANSPPRPLDENFLFFWERFGSDQFSAVRFGSVRFGSVRFGSDRFGSDRFGSDRFGSDRFGLMVGEEKIKKGFDTKGSDERVDGERGEDDGRKGRAIGSTRGEVGGVGGY
jgi:hypothetical protein